MVYNATLETLRFQLCLYQASDPTVFGINGYGIAMKLMLSVLEGYWIEETLARIILHLFQMGGQNWDK